MERKGFTLIELIIVIAIIAIISAVAIPRFVGYKAKASEETCISNRRSIFRAYLTLQAYGESVDMQDIIDNKDNKYFNNIAECPDGGTYTFSGNDEDGYTLSCSEHGDVHVNLTIGDDGSITYSFTKGSTFDDTESLFATAIGSSTNDWEITEEGLKNSTSYGEKLLYFDNNYDEYSIETTATLASNKEGYGIMFETYLDDDSNVGTIDNSEDLGYIFQFDPGYSDNGALIFRKRTDSGESGVLKDANGNSIEINPFTLGIDEFNTQGQDFWTNEHTIKIDVNEINPSEKQVDVYVDGVEVTGDYDIKVDALSGEQENKAGFRTWGSVQATVEDLDIEPL